MKVTIKTGDSISVALTAGGFALTSALYGKLPSRVPTHFDIHGVADGWMTRDVGAWLLPVSALVVWGGMRFGALLLPTATRARMQSVPIEAVTTLVVAMLIALQCVILRAALMRPPSVGPQLGVLLGVFWVAVGLFLPRVRRNRWVGVRTPWTLASDENWAKTHRVAGLTFCLGGALGALCTAFGAATLGITIIVGASLVPIVYSYSVARHGPPHA